MSAPASNLSSFPPPPAFYKLHASDAPPAPPAPPPIPTGKFMLFGLEFDPVS